VESEAMKRTLCWFSCGAASAVAAKLTLREKPDAVVAYCKTNAEHPDNERFMADCVRWFNAPVEQLASTRYRDTWDVFERRRYLAGIDGALCTVELKVMPRLIYQRPDDIHVFGYTADKADAARADRMRANYPEMTIETPLIQRAGIALPPMYAMGFHNNNCIPCVKATSPDYWALVRKQFPEQFERMAKLARELDVRLSRINDVRIFIDEIPADWPTTNPIQPSCDFLCHIAETENEAPKG
jgi:hypothetical protein